MTTTARAEELFNESKQIHFCSTDRLFGYLMVCQYIAAVIWALVASPRTWEGAHSMVHPHVWTAMLLGGLIAGPTAALTYYLPGRPVTRWTVSVCQFLMSALLIHVSGGRIETHFHVFGSLAFLAFYRDWRLLIPATVVVALDHVIRGFYAPASVYGVVAGAEWRFIEHATWVVFEDIILVASCLLGVREMRIIADRQARLETTNVEIERQVEERTKELCHSENRKAAILNNALDAIVSMDARGLITEFNPAAEAMFGYKRDEAVGKSLAELLIPEEHRAAHAAGLRRFLDTGESSMLGRRIEVAAVRSNGDRFPVELSITPVASDDGILFTAFVRDVGERKRLESELAHAQKMESVGRLAAGVAHEINTPNQYIGDNILFLQDSFAGLHDTIDAYSALHVQAKSEGFAPELSEKVDEARTTADVEFVLEEVPNAIGQALEGVERVASIVRAMKDFSHPGLEMHTSVEINRVIESTVTVARNEWKYVATVDLDLDRNLPVIQGHPGELGQVILNLVVNAVHAIKDRHGDSTLGEIRITSRAKRDCIEIRLSDNGAGIPKEVQSHIFEPFYTTKGVGIGTGQGLAISHTVIVDRHGGHIEFETQEGVGTTFTIQLPLEAAKEKAA
jgi:two-component system NtrC family sensor kinase